MARYRIETAGFPGRALYKASRYVTYSSALLVAQIYQRKYLWTATAINVDGSKARE
jgi:hypothetical protein